MIAQFAVMGNPISHSLSPVIHRYFAEQTGLALTYEQILVPEGEFLAYVDSFFAQGGRGLNITLPFKQQAYAQASVRTRRCEQAGAANTLWMRDQHMHADNTDGVGLLRDLVRHIDLVNQRILVLGAGGAARGIIAPLLAASIASLTVLNRTVQKAYALQREFPEIVCVESLAQEEAFDVIINATSAGMCRDETSWSWDLGCTLSAVCCYDLSYALNHPTPFVRWSQAQGARAVDGLGMLVEQAAEAFFIWHGVRPKILPLLDLLRT